VETHKPGAFPVTAIECLGHADQDVQRGAKYELDISKRRGESVKKYFEREIAVKSFSFSPTKGIATLNSRIAFSASGEGAIHARPAVNEAQRLRNRRVSIVFTRGLAPPPPPLPFADLFKGLFKNPIPGVPPLRPNYFVNVKFPTKDEWAAIVKYIRQSPVRFIDIKPGIQSLLEALEPPAGDTEILEKWSEGLTDALIDDERERKNRTQDPPGDPDKPDEDVIAPPTVNRDRPTYQLP
jgi:hypothetical protein